MDPNQLDNENPQEFSHREINEETKEFSYSQKLK